MQNRLFSQFAFAISAVILVHQLTSGEQRLWLHLSVFNTVLWFTWFLVDLLREVNDK